MKTQPVWLACGVLRLELENLLAGGKIDGRILFLDSMLHMVPETLNSELEIELSKADTNAERIVLVYGDCSAHMLDLSDKYRCSRVDALNCVQMLTGKIRYRELMRSQSFMLLPEWALRWKEIMRTELGLTPEIARLLMGENRTEIVYIDTGLAPVPVEELSACGDYTGLPFRIEQTGTDKLLALLLDAEGKLR